MLPYPNNNILTEDLHLFCTPPYSGQHCWRFSFILYSTMFWPIVLSISSHSVLRLVLASSAEDFLSFCTLQCFGQLYYTSSFILYSALFWPVVLKISFHSVLAMFWPAVLKISFHSVSAMFSPFILLPAMFWPALLNISFHSKLLHILAGNAEDILSSYTQLYFSWWCWRRPFHSVLCHVLADSAEDLLSFCTPPSFMGFLQVLALLKRVPLDLPQPEPTKT